MWYTWQLHYIAWLAGIYADFRIGKYSRLRQWHNRTVFEIRVVGCWNVKVSEWMQSLPVIRREGGTYVVMSTTTTRPTKAALQWPLRQSFHRCPVRLNGGVTLQGSNWRCHPYFSTTDKNSATENYFIRVSPWMVTRAVRPPLVTPLDFKCTEIV